MYDVRDYWLREGQKMLPPADAAKTKAQLDLLRSWISGDVYEIGCGWGRITSPLAGVPSVTSYTAIDISPRRIGLAQQTLDMASPRVRALVDLATGDFRVVGPALLSKDVVLGVEVLMHIPPSEIVPTVRWLASFSKRYVINIDWHEEIERAADDHNFQHPYAEIYRGIPRLKELRIFPLREFKQSLFVAELTA